MHGQLGGGCCLFFNFPVCLRVTLIWFRSNCARSTTVCSIETWRCCVNGSIRHRLTSLMDADSRSSSVPRVAVLLRRRRAKYRDSLLKYFHTTNPLHLFRQSHRITSIVLLCYTCMRFFQRTFSELWMWTSFACTIFCHQVDHYLERTFIPMSQTQADVELNPEVLDEIVEETGRVWMLWLLTPLALVAVAGVVFIVVRRFFGNADQ